MATSIAFQSVPQKIVDADGRPTPQFIRFLLDVVTAINNSPDTLLGVTTRVDGVETNLALTQYRSCAIQACADFGGSLTDGQFVAWNDAYQRFQLEAITYPASSVLAATVAADAAGSTIGTGPTQLLGFFGATPVAQQASAADLTNNVTAGGTDNQINNYTDLAVYATDAAAIRNNIYQLARKLKQVNDALRDYGLLS